jgi:membrane protein
MTGPMDRLQERLRDVRRRRPLLDQLLRMQEHYGAVTASQQAGAMTYFAFLSIFPLLAVAIFVVGRLAVIYPDAQDTLTTAINEVIPGLVGSGEGQISLDDVQRFSGLAGVLGLLGVLYAGLGWISAVREALEVTFEEPRAEQPGFVGAKVRDLSALAAIGATLFVSVVLAGAVTGFSHDVLSWLGMSDALSWLLYVVAKVVGVVVNTVLFFLIFRLLAKPHLPASALWKGALLGGLAFEVLKSVSFLILGSAQGNPAFQAFGVALVLVVWINYTSRVILYAASFAQVAPESRAARASRVVAPPVQGPQTPALRVDGAGGAVRATPAGRRTVPVTPFLAGAATMVAAQGIVKKVGRK